MKTNQPDNKIQSTYTLLVRSEEKERSLFETAVYSLLILSAVAAIWQFVHQPINLDTPSRTVSTQVSVAANS